MRFECGDLERALANSDLMSEAREHLKTCAACRREYRVWNDISATAKTLHEDWETPELWPKIREQLEAEKKDSPPWWKEWRVWGIAAAALIAIAIIPLLRWQHSPREVPAAENAAHVAATPKNSDFLTDQALQEVEQNERAYRKSIEKLSRIVEPKLAKASSPADVNSREKLVMLDSAISDTRANIKANRFNTHLQSALADLYREKQQTLEELVIHDRNN